MKLLPVRLLLAALIVGQSFMMGAVQANTRSMTCCASVIEHEAAGHAHCPPVSGTGGSCCPDCPVLLGAMLLAEATAGPHVNRPQIAVFPSVSLHASRRAERPPVPPPR